ncbi:MAG: prolyl oligopeptidase family serine peptidase, partial [Planctomycetales bacterium]
YPVIAFGQEFTHRRSQQNLAGDSANAEQLENLSSDKQVTAATPPTFIWHTNEDNGVLPENSVAFYLALRKAKVPAELHIYERGGHGLGLARSQPGASAWPQRCSEWLRSRELLE